MTFSPAPRNRRIHHETEPRRSVAYAWASIPYARELEAHSEMVLAAERESVGHPAVKPVA
jgi:hypothetical protein